MKTQETQQGKRTFIRLANIVAALHWIIAILAIIGYFVTTICLAMQMYPIFLKLWVVLVLVDLIPWIILRGQCPLWILEEWLRGEYKRQRFLEEKSFIVHYVYRLTGKRIPSVLVSIVMIIVFAIAAIAALIMLGLT